MVDFIKFFRLLDASQSHPNDRKSDFVTGFNGEVQPVFYTQQNGCLFSASSSALPSREHGPQGFVFSCSACWLLSLQP